MMYQCAELANIQPGEQVQLPSGHRYVDIPPARSVVRRARTMDL
jgi:hypothetical protein